MKLFEAFLISMESILSNKMRSLLTMLGLIIGISSVVAIMSLGQGTQDTIISNLGSLGVNRLTISYDRDAQLLEKDRMEFTDLEAIKKTFKDTVETVTPSINAMGVILGDIEESGVSITGANEDLIAVEDFDMKQGRMINEFDVSGRKRTAMIDSQLAKDLFGESAIGQRILVKSGTITNAMTVVGVYEKKESLFGYSQPVIYIPYTSMNDMYSLGEKLDGITVGFKQGYDVKQEGAGVLAFLQRLKGNVGEEKYSTFTAEDMIDIVTTTLGTVTLFIGAIAAISLVVGGIGIMNIMLVSVTERTREIGIRKALGARYKDIMMQFLIEALVISLLGGLIGTALGYAIVKVAGSFMDIQVGLSANALLIAIGFSTLIGLFFGLYPASKAAKLDPIEALRYE